MKNPGSCFPLITSAPRSHWYNKGASVENVVAGEAAGAMDPVPLHRSVHS